MNMDNGGKSIKRVKLYACGCCKNDLGIVFRGHPTDKRTFPALVVLIEHNTVGNILYDTGYSELVYKNGLVSKIYNTLNKTFISENEIIDNRLRGDGIDPDSIDHIILSHAHPDHIGALKRFSGYELISTKEVFEKLDSGKKLSLTFTNMIPEDEYRRKIVRRCKNKGIFDGFFPEVYDVSGDGSIIGVRLDGHAEGQLGIFLPELKLFFAADSCWGEDLLSEIPKMRPLPRLIQNNYKKYAATAESLLRFKSDHPEIKIIFSHGAVKEKCYEQ